MPEPCVITFPIDNKGYLNNGKFSYSGTDADGVKKSFKLDLKTHKFSFSAKNIDLSGLSCPLNVRVDIGDYNTDTNVDEYSQQPQKAHTHKPFDGRQKLPAS